MLDEYIKELYGYCKGSVTITINSHKDVYETVDEYFKSAIARQQLDEEDIKDIPADTYTKMVELNTIVELHCYIDSPVGYIFSYHYDLAEAITEMVQSLRKDRAVKRLER